MDTLEDMLVLYFEALDLQREAADHDRNQAEEDATLEVERYEARLREILSLSYTERG